ncbi:MAG: 50S ribosomal protein L11 methyltransferase [Oscillospiraceae bacterium]|nr:50S ribosomal protein L11 methyltransferase [Oscillospiraceae bacterium]
MEQKLIKLDIFTSKEGLNVVGTALEELGHPAFIIVDPSDFDQLLDGKYGAWDYFDKNLTSLKHAEPSITLYLLDDEDSNKHVDDIQKMLKQLKTCDHEKTLGRLECVVSCIDNVDWNESWKQTVEPFPVGEKLIICPPWNNDLFEGKVILQMEPGQAFGTGTDETTSLCLEALDNMNLDGTTVLDIGCGSGILSIAGLLLGADSALGIDIDQVAVNTATENATINNVSHRAKYVCGNLIDVVSDKYDIVCANIIADVIITLLPQVKRCLKPDGVLILSGILADREEEVVEIALKCGYIIKERREKNDWVCLVVMKPYN